MSWVDDLNEMALKLVYGKLIGLHLFLLSGHQLLELLLVDVDLLPHEVTGQPQLSGDVPWLGIVLEVHGKHLIHLGLELGISSMLEEVGWHIRVLLIAKCLVEALSQLINHGHIALGQGLLDEWRAVQDVVELVMQFRLLVPVFM